MRPVTDMPPCPIDLTPDEIDRDFGRRCEEELKRRSVLIPVPRRIVDRGVALELLRRELGDHTRIDCTERFGDWVNGGPPHVTRRWNAFYNPTPGVVDPKPIGTHDCLSPYEAATALIRRVRGMAPVTSTLTVEHDEEPAKLPPTQDDYARAHHEAAEFVASEETPERWDGQS